jgi:predicted nucleotidyltransferase
MEVVRGDFNEDSDIDFAAIVRRTRVLTKYRLETAKHREEVKNFA